MRFSSLLALFLISNFTVETTPLSFEFVPVTLHIVQWFRVIKSFFSSTMSPIQKFLDILTHFWRSCKVCINSFLHLLQNSLLRCWILLHLPSQYKLGFWKTPGGSITTFALIVSILFRDISIGLCPSLIVSTDNGREFIIASVSVISVCRDSSSKLYPCVCRREFKIALAGFICGYQIPSMWLVAGGFFFQVTQSPAWSWRMFSILL